MKKIIFFIFCSLFCWQTSVEAGCGCWYPSRGICEPFHQFMIHADFLYWQPTFSNFPYAGRFSQTPDLVTEELLKNRFNFTPGFRIGGAWQFDCGWDLAADWTRLHAHASASASQPLTNQSGLLAAWFIFPLPITSIDAHQTLNYDIVNIDFVKTFSLGSAFVCRPFFGPLGVFIHQKLDMDSIAILVSTTEEESNVFQDSTLENKFNGGGLRLGIESEYYPCSCLSIYGKGSCSLAFGDFTLNQHYTVGTPTPFSENFNEKERAVVTGFDILAGIRGCFSICGCNIMANVSYEFVLWPNQIRLKEGFPADSFFVTLRGVGDIGFQGLTTGLAVTF